MYLECNCRLRNQANHANVEAWSGQKKSCRHPLVIHSVTLLTTLDVRARKIGTSQRRRKSKQASTYYNQSPLALSTISSCRDCLTTIFLHVVLSTLTERATRPNILPFQHLKIRQLMFLNLVRGSEIGKSSVGKRGFQSPN